MRGSAVIFRATDEQLRSIAAILIEASGFARPDPRLISVMPGAAAISIERWSGVAVRIIVTRESDDRYCLVNEAWQPDRPWRARFKDAASVLEAAAMSADELTTLAEIIENSRARWRSRQEL